MGSSPQNTEYHIQKALLKNFLREGFIEKFSEKLKAIYGFRTINY
jgi:hypothetical protein